jgi:hypothetical protein
MSFSMASSMDKVNKRASSVQKLAEENERLKEQLKEMSDRCASSLSIPTVADIQYRLEAAERRRKQLAEKEQKVTEEPSS